VIGILIEHNQSSIPKYGQVLALTDNSSAVGWLHHANCNPQTSPELYNIASKLASTCISSSFSIHPQHIKGCHNNTADSLYHLHHLPDTQLTQFILHRFPDQVPHNFKISPIPHDISSWISSILPIGQASFTVQPKTPMKRKTELGDAGHNFSANSTYPPTPSSTASHPPNAHTSVKHLSKPSAPAYSPHNHENRAYSDTIRSNYEEELFKLPLASWLRTLGTLDDPARSISKTTLTSSIFNSNDFIALGRN
jgi:hypothetical protein